MREISLMCLFGLTAFDDLRTKEVRILEVVIFGLLGVLINIFCPLNSIYSILGGVAIGIIAYLYSLFSNEKIGKGDALIIMVSGLYLGYVDTIILLWISSLLALIGGMMIIKRRKTDKNYDIPFVPFLMLGYLLMFLIEMIRNLML